MFIEGLRTEEDYLTYWRRQYRDRVLIDIDPFRGGPLQLVETAVEAQRSEAHDAKRGRGRSHDQIWCMFDRDEHPTSIEPSTSRTGTASTWPSRTPALSYGSSSISRTVLPIIERQKAQDRAEELLGCSKALSESALSALAEGYDEARRRAVKLDEKHEGDGSPPRTNPSSGVCRLIDVIRNA